MRASAEAGQLLPGPHPQRRVDLRTPPDVATFTAVFSRLADRRSALLAERSTAIRRSVPLLGMGWRDFLRRAAMLDARVIRTLPQARKASEQTSDLSMSAGALANFTHQPCQDGQHMHWAVT